MSARHDERTSRCEEGEAPASAISRAGNSTLPSMSAWVTGLVWIFALLAQDEAAEPTPATSAYAGALHAAAAALEAHDVDAAQRALDSAELQRRGFEWEHLHLAMDLARSSSAGPGVDTPTGLSKAHLPDEVAAPKVVAISTLRRQLSSGRAVAISPAGDRIASTETDDDVCLWRANTGDVERLLVGHTGTVTALAFSPEGARLASSSEDGTARIWNVNDGSCPLTLKPSAGAVSAVAWSPDGKILATADASFAVRVWDAFQSEPRFAVRQQTGTIRALAFSPDSRRVAAASEDGSVCVLDTTSGAVLQFLRGGKGAATACCFDPSNGRLLVGRQDWTIGVYDAKSGELSATLRQKRAAVESITFTEDGSRFAVGTKRGSLQVWDARSNEQLLVLQEVGDPVHCVAFDARGTRLLATGDDHMVRIFETRADVARGVQRASLESLPSDEAAAEMKPMEIEARCRRVVEHAGLDPALYERAEKLAHDAWDRLKESAQLHSTLAAAIYRRDRTEEALAMLVEAGDKKRGWPPNLAFRTMALAKLGRIEEARVWMVKLDTLLHEERWSSDADARALAEEARAVLAAAKPAAR